jgi:tRNA dimethylallyltransferase
MVKSKGKIIVILGPTAVGKTKVGVKLAAKFDGEIISADSRQVYKGMDVGTGKDLKEYTVRSTQSAVKSVPYHLIDVVSPEAEFNVAKFQKLAYKAIKDILRRKKLPIIVGGAGLYIDAVVEGYQFNKTKKQQIKKTRERLSKLTLKQLLVQLKKIDLETYKVVDRKNRRRVQRALEIYYETGQPKSAVIKKQKPPYRFLKIGITYPKETIAQKIEARLSQRLEKEGMVEEVERLHREGLSWRKLENFGLEYRWISRYLQDKINYTTMLKHLSQDTKNFAKRQMTWFKRDKEIMWENNYDKIEKLVAEFLK